MQTEISSFIKFQITENNPYEIGDDRGRELYIKNVENKFNAEYFCFSEEIGGDTGTFHVHLYVKNRYSVRFDTLKRAFPRAHIERAVGTSEQNRDYVFKEGKFKDSEKALTNIVDSHYEFGECPPDDKQGKRNDIKDMYYCVQNGMTNVEILSYNPRLATRINEMNTLRNELQYEENRKKLRFLHVTYISGDTATGKSRYILEEHGLENVYRVTDYKHPFDSYRAEKVLVFEEFRSQIPIEQMLNYLDIYPCSLPSRYNNKVACYTKVYIVSNWLLAEQYPKVHEQYPKDYEAFCRRIHTQMRFTKYGNKPIILDDVSSDYQQSVLPFIDTKNDEDLPY